MSLTILFKGLYKYCSCGCGELIRIVDKHRRYKKNYIKNSPEILAYHKEYYRKNRERISERDKLKRRALKDGVDKDLVEKTLRNPLDQIKDI